MESHKRLIKLGASVTLLALTHFSSPPGFFWAWLCLKANALEKYLEHWE